MCVIDPQIVNVRLCALSFWTWVPQDFFSHKKHATTNNLFLLLGVFSIKTQKTIIWQFSEMCVVWMLIMHHDSKILIKNDFLISI